ncbi:glycosyl hydrolase 2 galactose-binding domain-containing protein [Flavobacterium sp. FlaQc-50]|uniref:glycosyl hydrolase 2 galactose-binding domain-containing protein n=1 Tax=unclassified Flavobacterium TaxID=196869 RepID=UPI003756629A
MKNINYTNATLISFLFWVMSSMMAVNAQNVKFEQQLKEGWTIASSAQINNSGDKISVAGFDVSKWYTTTVPSTVMASLIANKEYADIFMGENISKVDTTRFRVPWWYRNEFVIEDTSKNTELQFEGINYRANVWLNGSKIAAADSLFGGFRIFTLNISKHIKKGKNVLAVEVFHQKPDEPSIGFVDWAPMAPDRELGLWRPVKLKISDKTSLNNIFVTSKIDKKEYKNATLEISAEAVNHTNEAVEALLKGKIENITFEKKVTLQPFEKRIIVFKSSEFKQLNIKNPRLWWTYELGKPNLYTLTLSIETNKKVSYSKATSFGIREVEDYITAKGYRGYKLNGVEVLIKGGGWVDGMFLNDTEEKVKAQLEYVKQTNMNTVRMEGFWGNSERIYEMADEMGLLLMVGWSCQWEWKGYLDKPEDDFMSIKTPEDMNLIINYTRDHVNWLRNHPSIFVWVMGSDKLPRPELEEKYNILFKEIDTSRPLLMSCKGMESTISGKTGVKMNGPYEYVAPNYWFVDTENGGAFGFNTETGPGPQVPSLEVVKSMIPEDKLWPINTTWDFHCGRNEFQTLERFTTAFNNRYGIQNNVEDFTFKSQASNLESMRSMYEAFAINRSNTTGIVQWMFNSPWPKLIWQFWDYNLLPNAAFYGARLGARQVNIAYNYGDNAVYVSNLNPQKTKKLKARVKVFDFDGKVIFEKEETVSVNGNASYKTIALPNDKAYSKIYFLKMNLSDENGKSIADNFYWLSTKKDVFDFKKSDWIHTPLMEYADFKDLDKLPKVKIAAQHTIKKEKENYEVTVELKNPSAAIAFLIELNIVGDLSGKSIVPVLWEDNYISLVPKESRTIKVTFPVAALKGEKPVFRYKGWNVD